MLASKPDYPPEFEYVYQVAMVCSKDYFNMLYASYEKLSEDPSFPAEERRNIRTICLPLLDEVWKQRAPRFRLQTLLAETDGPIVEETYDDSKSAPLETTE